MVSLLFLQLLHASCRSSQKAMCSTKKIHFFIFLHPSLLTHGPPGFPQAFLREHANSLSKAAFLHLPTGAEWRVELLELNGEVLLGSGWQRFADFYSLGYEQFLLFRYEGSSHFHVLIFDRTASEIEYPYSTAPADHDQSHPEVSVEILEDFPSPRSTSYIDMINISSSEETLHQKGASRLPKFEEAQSDFQTTQKTTKTTGCDRSSRPAKACSSRPPYCSSIPNFRDGALARAEAFKSETPFFLVTMRPSYVGNRSGVNVPLSFFRRHFKRGSDHIMLWVSEGRSWWVNFSWGKTSIHLFTGGWRNFARDNSLKLNDVCVFQLMKSTSPALKVVIFRNNEDASHHIPQRM